MGRTTRRGPTRTELLILAGLGAGAAAILVASPGCGPRTVDVRPQGDVPHLAVAASMYAGVHGVPPLVHGGGSDGAVPLVYGGVAGRTVRLATRYTDDQGRPFTDDVGGAKRVWPEIEYLLSLFPQIDLNDTGLRLNGKSVPVTELAANEAFVFWVSGGRYTRYAGFSPSPTRPLAAPASGEEPRSYLAVPRDRVRNPMTGVEDGQIRDPWGQPYVVFGYSSVTREYGGLNPYGVRPYTKPDGEVFNPKGLQFVSAGPDGRFGPGGPWTPGAGMWAPGERGADDIGSFVPGTLGGTK